MRSESFCGSADLRRLPADGKASRSAPAITKTPREGELPLSFAQQRLWFSDRSQPDSAFYNVAGAIRLSGPLDVDALSASLQELVRRHETLRTTFSTTEGHARQQIAAELELPLPVVDVQGGDLKEVDMQEVDLKAAVRRRAEEEARTPFDLARGPLLRTTLLRLADTEHVLLVTMHHIVSDGGSMGVVVRELGALYEAFSMGRPPALPTLPVQYADYAGAPPSPPRVLLRRRAPRAAPERHRMAVTLRGSLRNLSMRRSCVLWTSPRSCPKRAYRGSPNRWRRSSQRPVR
jgi:hypothetical protein